MASNRTAEMTLAVLDVMDAFIDDFMETLREDECHNDLMSLVYEVYAQIMMSDQSKPVVERLLSHSLNLYVNEFYGLLFSGSPEYAGEFSGCLGNNSFASPFMDLAGPLSLFFCVTTEHLCHCLLSYCNSPITEVRCKAATFLFLLLHNNHKDDHTPGISRIKVWFTVKRWGPPLRALLPRLNKHHAPISLQVQLIKAFAALLEDTTRFVTDAHLKRSLTTVLLVSQNVDKYQQSDFRTQLEKLVVDLYTLLRCATQLKVRCRL